MRAVLLTSAVTTLLGLLVAFAGLWQTAPDIPSPPRFWATTFFILLLWPIPLTLLGLIAGVRPQRIAGALLLLATIFQQASPGALPLPEHVRWHVTLTEPGAAVRQRILLPAPDDPKWTRAWRAARRVVLAVCTGGLVPPDAPVSLALNDRSPVPLSSLPRVGPSQDDGWYLLPVARETLDTVRPLDVTIRRDGAAGGAVRICGGRDDPQRPGAGGALRLHGATWTTADLADPALPLVGGKPPISRYYIELRFLDADGRPSIAIYY
jgi:hypothetical protein